jgi:hypothetical protein
MSAADDLGKEHLLGQILKTFGITLNRHKIKDFILHAASSIYKLIEVDIKGALPSIVFDSASRNNRNVFCVSLRYLKNGKIKERTIGILTQKGSQTGTVLASQIIEMMAKVGKSPDDIYSTCADNAKNMAKASRLIASAQKQLNIISLFSQDGIKYFFK